MKQVGLIITTLFLGCNLAFALPIPSQSQQLLLVKTPDESAVQGTLQRYERIHQQWVAVGEAVPIVVGKKGMAQDKKEGDMRTPVGVFALGSTFGFDTKGPKEPYMQLTPTTFCVDDVKSAYYNKIIDTASIKTPDWQSGEQMRDVPFYKWGAVVQYNTPHIVKDKGSCIFMHIWRNSDSGTAGCIAMEESNLKQILGWLDHKKKPVIALYPRDVTI